MYSVVDVSFCMIGAFSWGIQDFLLAVAIRNIITQSVVYIIYKICGPDEIHQARKLYQVVN